MTGVEAGEVEVTVAASHSGFATATASFEVIVEDLFDLSLWRELVFDAFDCPNGFTDESCRHFWGERDVENRITAVLPFVPDFHLVSPGRGWRFTSTQEDTIRDAIRAAVKQITGQEFVGQVTTGRSLRDEYGWVDVIAVENDFWGRPRGPCGAAAVGKTEGVTLINVDRLDACDLYPLAMHEVGHALGFFHVLNLGDYIMSPLLTEIPPVFSEGEQFHAQLAWELGRGAPYTPDPRKDVFLNPHDPEHPLYRWGGSRTSHWKRWSNVRCTRRLIERRHASPTEKIAQTAWNAGLRAVLPVGPGTARRRRAAERIADREGSRGRLGTPTSGRHRGRRPRKRRTPMSGAVPSP